MVRFREATVDDYEAAASMPRDDGFNLTSAEALEVIMEQAPRSHYSGVYEIDGEAVVLMGVVCQSLFDERGLVWMTEMPGLQRHPRAFVRAARKVLEDLPFPTVVCVNNPSFRNTGKWLRRLGFAKVSDVEIKGVIHDVLEVNRGT